MKLYWKFYLLVKPDINRDVYYRWEDDLVTKLQLIGKLRTPSMNHFLAGQVSFTF